MTEPLEIWLFDLARCAEALMARQRREGWIPPDDLVRIERIVDPAQRQERLVSHVALRLALKRFIGDTIRSQIFSRLESGKPVLEGHDLDFSLTHIEGLAMVAVSANARVGIDVERVRPVAIDATRKAAIEQAAARLSPHLPLPPPGDARRFQQAWTRLEALAKARGIGMARVLAEVGVVARSRATGIPNAHGGDGLDPAPAAVTDAAAPRGGTPDAARPPDASSMACGLHAVTGLPASQVMATGFSVVDFALAAPDLLAALAIARPLAGPPPLVAVGADLAGFA